MAAAIVDTSSRLSNINPLAGSSTLGDSLELSTSSMFKSTQGQTYAQSPLYDPNNPKPQSKFTAVADAYRRKSARAQSSKKKKKSTRHSENDTSITPPRVSRRNRRHDHRSESRRNESRRSESRLKTTRRDRKRAPRVTSTSSVSRFESSVPKKDSQDTVTTSSRPSRRPFTESLETSQESRPRHRGHTHRAMTSRRTTEVFTSRRPATSRVEKRTPRNAGGRRERLSQTPTESSFSLRRPRMAGNFSVSAASDDNEESSDSSDWDFNEKMLKAVRSGPSDWPDYILAKHPAFGNGTPSPYMMYYFDETAPNDVLLANDVKDAHPVVRAKHKWQKMWKAKPGKETEFDAEVYGVEDDETFSLNNRSVENKDDLVSSVTSYSVGHSYYTESAFTSIAASAAPQVGKSTRKKKSGGGIGCCGRGRVMSVSDSDSVVRLERKLLGRTDEPIPPEATNRSSRRTFPPSPEPVETTARSAPPSATAAPPPPPQTPSRFMDPAPPQLPPVSIPNTVAAPTFGNAHAASPASFYGVNQQKFSRVELNEYIDYNGDVQTRAGAETLAEQRRKKQLGRVPPVYPHRDLQSLSTWSDISRPEKRTLTLSTESRGNTRTDVTSSSDTTEFRGKGRFPPPRRAPSLDRISEETFGKRRPRGAKQPPKCPYCRGTGKCLHPTDRPGVCDGCCGPSPPGRKGGACCGGGDDFSLPTFDAPSTARSASASASLRSPSPRIKSRGVDEGSFISFIPGPADDISSDDADRPKLKPSNRPETCRNYGYHVRKCFFNAAEKRIPSKGTEARHLPQYSVSYKNYPTMCYDVLAPADYSDFYRRKRAPGFFG